MSARADPGFPSLHRVMARVTGMDQPRALILFSLKTFLRKSSGPLE